jgi:hypothetical protein
MAQTKIDPTELNEYFLVTLEVKGLILLSPGGFKYTHKVLKRSHISSSKTKLISLGFILN